MFYNSTVILCLLVIGCCASQTHQEMSKKVEEVTPNKTLNDLSGLRDDLMNEALETVIAEGINEENRDANGTAVRAKRYSGSSSSSLSSSRSFSGSGSYRSSGSGSNYWYSSGSSSSRSEPTTGETVAALSVFLACVLAIGVCVTVLVIKDKKAKQKKKNAKKPNNVPV